MENKVVVITGGSSGAGESLAYKFSREGYDVVIGGTNLERLKNVQSKIKLYGSKCELVVHDVSELLITVVCKDSYPFVFGVEIQSFNLSGLG